MIKMILKEFAIENVETAFHLVKLEIYIEDDHTKDVEFMRITVRNREICRLTQYGKCGTIYSRVPLDHYLLFLLFSLYFFLSNILIDDSDDTQILHYLVYLLGQIY